MARAALDLSARDLARQAGLPLAAISRFEKGQTLSVDRAMRLRATLEQAGLVFLDEDAADGAGLRLTKTFRKGFLYDADGKQLAAILGDAVVDVARGTPVATVRGNEIYALDGSRLGPIGMVDIFQKTGSLPRPALRLLLDDAAAADAGPRPPAFPDGD